LDSRDQKGHHLSDGENGVQRLRKYRKRSRFLHLEKNARQR